MAKDHTRRVVTGAALLIVLAGAAASAGAAPAEGAAFTCTEVIGVSVTGDWFGAGFENGVDGARWQARTRKHAFIQLWGNPKDEVWSLPVVSRCAHDSDKPDRVLFTGVNWEFKTAAEWTAAFEKAVAMIKAKYPGVRQIELLTMLRGPGNKTCGDPRTVVAPYIDEAVAHVAAAHPGLVRVGPKVEAPRCAVFDKGGPHFTEAGMKEVARAYAAQYGGAVARR